MSLAAFLFRHGISKVLNIAIPDDYVEHGNVELLRKEVGLDEASITERILEELNRIEKAES